MRNEFIIFAIISSGFTPIIVHFSPYPMFVFHFMHVPLIALYSE